MPLIVWFVVLLLIAVNAIYVAAEFATVSVRRSRVAQLAEDGNRLARLLLPTLTQPARLDSYIAACQIGITWSSLVLGAYTQTAMAPGLGQLLERWGALEPLIAFSAASAIVLVTMTTLQVVLGELVPKSAALQFPTQVALGLVVPMRASLKLYAWFLALLNGSGLGILRLFGVKPSAHYHVHSPEEIEFFIGESRRGGLIEVQEHERLRRALRLASRPASHLMVPRRFIVGLSIDAQPATIMEVLAANNFTRIPVYEGSPENVVGVLHTKDLVAEVARSGVVPPIRSIARLIPCVPEGASAGALLDVLRRHKSHLALVADEYGSNTGLVTFGDLLTDLLGGITGKARFGQPPPARLADGRVRLPGLMRLDEAADWVGIKRTGRASTIGGLVLQASGRIPQAGEKIRIDGLEFEIERVGHQSVTSVLIRPLPDPEGDPA